MWKECVVASRHEIRQNHHTLRVAWESWRDVLFAERQKRLEQQRPETSVPVVSVADSVDARANSALLVKDKPRFRRIRSLVQPNRGAKLSTSERTAVQDYLHLWHYNTVRHKRLRTAARVLSHRAGKLKARRYE